MKGIVSLGIFMFALSFCNLAERFIGKKETNPPPGAANSSTGSATEETVEKPRLTDWQQFILDGADEVKWDAQGMSWELPKGWKQINATKDSFNYSSPDQAFLLVNVSHMPNNFPADVSLKATHDGNIQQMQNGKYENVRYLEIDGVKGVEFIETMPADKSGPRRRQWIAYRPRDGQIQMLNVMLSTKGSNFEKHRDDFPAILYSMKIAK
jgi:hypothetical protein